MNSYDKINYKLRPQKRIERALMIDLINKFRYCVNEPVNYIGMGSLYYTDFVYFNKNCELERMFSIEYMIDEVTGEKNEQKEKRFFSNKPLNKITLIPKLVSEAIDDGDLPFTDSNFIWYDYDGSFSPATIEDLRKTIDETTKSSIIAVSYNSNAPRNFKDSKYVVNTKKCVKEYKAFMIGSEVVEDEFVVDKYADTVGLICEKYLQKAVEEKNEVLETKFKLFRISKIIYQDGVKMTTFIWVLIDTEKHPNLEKDLINLKISGDKDLTMQNLTLYEKIYLDKHCDLRFDQLSKDMGLEMTTIERYFEYAKYIPEFTEIVL